MTPEQIYFDLIDKERNIYEPARLYDQNRESVKNYIDNMRAPGDNDAILTVQDGSAKCAKNGKSYRIENEVLDFIEATAKRPEDKEWERLNTQFLNYHRSLSVYTLINSVPVANYLSLRSGMGDIKNKTVVDIGAGTGHVLCSFFQNPETIDYYLVDPNLRLLHDQFIRIYPKLTRLKIKHILAFAEQLPFKSEFADVVMSLSAIDHFKDYKAFFAEAYRILKPGGTIFISSHLDIPPDSKDATKTSQKLFSESFYERLARYLYYKRNKVGHDDHTYHFDSLEPFENGLKEKGFVIEKSEIFKRYFFVIAKKP
ncbi:MAG: class I SAM-dependent methyltransferase [Bacteroidia bacterium]|nr:class I SAM-dependent methyltransferase [Bacteroidia bacterium]MCZ2249352.1 class I SAM-dependent methyltransferase [Bacteroidia bacterium]